MFLKESMTHDKIHLLMTVLESEQQEPSPVQKQTNLPDFSLSTSSIANFALTGHNKNVYSVKMIIIMH
jgi:hypothetical protein